MTFRPSRILQIRQVEEELDAIEPLLDTPELSKYVRERISSACLDLFAVVGGRANVRRLEAAAGAAVSYDFPALKVQLDRLAGLSGEVLEPGTEEEEARGARHRLANAKSLIETTEAQLAEIEPMEIGLRFELYVDRALADFLAILRRNSKEMGELVALATGSLARVDERSNEKCWARVLKELRFEALDDDPWRSRLPVVEAIVPRSFFENVTPADRPAKIARYIVEVRPRLVLEAFRAGSQGVPFPPLSVTRLLAAKADPDPASAAEQKLTGGVMFLAQLMRMRLHQGDEELARTLGVSERSRLLLGEPEKRSRELVPDEGLARVMVAELRTVARSLAVVVGGDDDPELALLLRYKRALEVGLPESRRELRSRGEVALQRHLCSFLIRHGAAAVGTRFGRAETDIVTGRESDPLVVEAKLFKKAATPRKIEAAFIQLGTYMDQTAPVSRGALVLFNFSNVPIHASRELLGGRVAIVAVNLCESTPSQQDRRIEVRGGPPGSPAIEVIPHGAVPGPARRRAGRARLGSRGARR